MGNEHITPDPKFTIHLLKPQDESLLEWVASCYEQEWHFAGTETIIRLKNILSDPQQIQVVLKMDGKPVATAGIYRQLRLFEKVPRLANYSHWLALVYTLPEYRKLGCGTQLCKQMEVYASHLGIDTLYLYTDTAEWLYRKIGWQIMERIQVENRNLAIMSLAISPGLNEM